VKKAEAAQLEPPTVIVVGEVVRLREKLNWFETRPLFGTTVLVTRPREQAGEFADLLTAYGAHVIAFPTIAIVPPADWEPLDQALADLAGYDWVIFTSVNGVRFFFERLRALGRDVRAVGHARFCAIGPRTAEALAGRGFRADLVPAEYQAEGVLEAFKKENLKGVRVLIPRAEVARDLLPDELRGRGAKVTVAVAYRTIRPDMDAASIKAQLQKGAIGVVTFTSSSSVRNYVELFADQHDARRLTGNAVVACIGPITAETAESFGFTVRVRAKENTIPALADAIVEYVAHTSCDV
jgi:uroporphyrinogen III methyltransferase/synthase